MTANRPTSSGSELLAAFADLVRDGWESGHALGTVRLDLIGSDVSALLGFDRGGVSVTAALDPGSQPPRAADAWLALPERLVARMVDEPHAWDHREAEFVQAVRFGGNLDLINAVAEAAKRPTPDTMQRIAEVRRQAQRSAARSLEIPTLRAPQWGEVIELLREGVPSVVRDCLQGEGWQLDAPQLRARFGHVAIQVPSAPAFGTIADLIDAGTGSAAYSSGCMLPPQLWRHFRLAFGTSADFLPAQLWMGCGDASSPCTRLHMDTRHGLLGHVYGTKQLLLYSPDQADLLYPHKGFSYYQLCAASPRTPDHARHPRFTDARAIELTLQPGDLLVNPAGWYHEVYALGPVLSVSRFLEWSAWDRYARTD
jgi:Cupin-like domain